MDLAREISLLKEKDNILQTNHFGQKKQSPAREFFRDQSKFSVKNSRGFSCHENLARENLFSREPREISLLKRQPRVFFLFPLLSGVK